MPKEIILGFDIETKKAMQEYFSGKICSKCGDDANRVTVSNIFYCHTCHDYKEVPVEVKRLKNPDIHVDSRRLFNES